MPQAKEQIGVALGRIPSGASVATATHGGQSTGLLASWIQQVSFDPPMVVLAVKKGRPIEPLIDGSGAFVLNVLGAGDNARFKHFAKGFAPGQDAFKGIKVEPTPSGPALPDAIARLECKVAAKHAAGDHNVYFGEVIGGTASAEAKPYVHLRQTGLSY